VRCCATCLPDHALPPALSQKTRGIPCLSSVPRRRSAARLLLELGARFNGGPRSHARAVGVLAIVQPAGRGESLDPQRVPPRRRASGGGADVFAVSLVL